MMVQNIIGEILLAIVSNGFEVSSHIFYDLVP